jgi:hypothetical protein
MKQLSQNKIPRSGAERETLRTKGQFWTPDWIADCMTAYVLLDKPDKLLDPALGEGVFFRAAKRYSSTHGFALALFGRDTDPEVIPQARNSGLSNVDLVNVEIRDFILDPPRQKFPAIIANPPYIRHHRIPKNEKYRLSDFAHKATGRRIDGRAGLHVYFLVRALLSLEPEGRLAYIVSADICEGVFSRSLWEWICSRYRLDAVISFTSEAAPFPDVDINALIFLIRNSRPVAELDWINCKKRNPKALISAISGRKVKNNSSEIQILRRNISEALENGLSRVPDENKYKYKLGDFANVMRGIVTGDNDFFFMTHAKAVKLGIPDSLLTKAVGRVRDIRGDVFSNSDIERLEADGRPTLLLNINGMPFEKLPENVRKYIEEGERNGLPEKTLIKTRNPWYRMETRRVPPILFAYLGRRNARFIRNHANVVPLTCLLCIYPKQNTLDFSDRLWKVLSHPETIANLRKVGKTYGGGAIKVEPRALERLPLPESLVQAESLDKYICQKQREFFAE